jgi:hypothetical protein
MSEQNDFKDVFSKRHFFAIITVFFAMPLLPMLMGWYTLLA